MKSMVSGDGSAPASLLVFDTSYNDMNVTTEIVSPLSVDDSEPA